MKIIIMKNDAVTSKGNGVLMLCSEDYDKYAEELNKKFEKEALPKEIQEAMDYNRHCESDMGFMGSPKYYENQELLENYFKK